MMLLVLCASCALACACSRGADRSTPIAAQGAAHRGIQRRPDPVRPLVQVGFPANSKHVVTAWQRIQSAHGERTLPWVLKYTQHLQATFVEALWFEPASAHHLHISIQNGAHQQHFHRLWHACTQCLGLLSFHAETGMTGLLPARLEVLRFEADEVDLTQPTRWCR